jgi:hypothetical protein
MALNGEIDVKVANSITSTANVILGSLKCTDLSDIEGEGTMKTNRQYTVQYLLRMAEITGDEVKRNQWLTEAEQLLFKDIPGVTGKLTIAEGTTIEVKSTK